MPPGPSLDATKVITLRLRLKVAHPGFHIALERPFRERVNAVQEQNNPATIIRQLAQALGKVASRDQRTWRDRPLAVRRGDPGASFPFQHV